MISEAVEGVFGLSIQCAGSLSTLPQISHLLSSVTAPPQIASISVLDSTSSRAILWRELIYIRRDQSSRRSGRYTINGCETF